MFKGGLQNGIGTFSSVLFPFSLKGKKEKEQKNCLIKNQILIHLIKYLRNPLK